MNLKYPNGTFPIIESDFANIGSLREIDREAVKRYLPKGIRKYGLRRKEAIPCVYPVQFSAFNM